MATKTKSKTKKKTTTKAKAAPKTSAKPAGNGKALAKARAAKSAERKEADTELLAKINSLVESGKTQAEIAAKLNVTTNKVGFLLLQASVKPKDRVKGTDAEVAKAIVKLRNNEQLSWPAIMARTGFSQQKVKSLYETLEGKGTANQGYAVVSARAADRAGDKPARKEATKKAPSKRKRTNPSKG